MKSLLIAVALLFTQTAAADYFFCTVKVGYFDQKTEEAEYRVLRASAELRPFKCEGQIKGWDTVVKITSTETGDFKVKTGRGTVSVDMYGLDVHGDGLDYGVCECGMQ